MHTMLSMKWPCMTLHILLTMEISLCVRSIHKSSGVRNYYLESMLYSKNSRSKVSSLKSMTNRKKCSSKSCISCGVKRRKNLVSCPLKCWTKLKMISIGNSSDSETLTNDCKRLGGTKSNSYKKSPATKLSTHFSAKVTSSAKAKSTTSTISQAEHNK